MSGHTPGPWAIEPCTHMVWGPAPSDDTRTWGNPICEARATHHDFGRRNITPEQAGANAHLIAAAPDMLEALEEGIELEDGELTGVEWKEAVRAWLKKSRAIVAKAKGVQHG